MTRESQKDRERFYVSRLVAHLDIDDLEEIEAGDPAPDFKLTWKGGRAGVEVTRLFQPTEQEGMSLQAVEAARNRMFDTARELWSEQDHPYVEILVHFNSATPVRRENTHRLARQLVELVKMNLPSVNDYTRLDFQWENRSWFPEEFVSVRIVRLEAHTRSYWSGSSGGYLPVLSQDRIQQAINRKKNHRYSDAAGEAWLLIVMESTRLSGAFDIDDEVDAVEDCGEFDRVFVLDSLSSRVLEPSCNNGSVDAA